MKAPAERVYAAWTDPKMIMHWFGPAGATPLSAETDVRVGGRFRMTFGTPDGEQHDVRGTYLEVEPARKLVFTWCWITLPPERQSQVTVTLKPLGAETVLILTHEQLFDAAAREGHLYGWGGALDKLEIFVSEEI
jgi:uncharacterized protein YndB with AHSA1/START domain